MENTDTTRPVSRLAIFRNWISFSGLVLVLGSLFAFLLLFTIDTIAHVSNPYIGILTYFIAPGFTVLGWLLATVGALIRRWRLKRSHGLTPTITIDLGRAHDRKMLGFFLAGSSVFLLITAIGTY